MLPRWTGADDAGGGTKVSTSPTPAAALAFFRPRLTGPGLRRLLIVLASLLLFYICISRFSSETDELLAVTDGVRRLPWIRPSLDTKSAAFTANGNATTDQPQEEQAHLDADGYLTDATTRLPHIPAKIWHIYLDFKPSAMSTKLLTSWLYYSPSYSYTLLDKAGALGLVARLVGRATAQGTKQRVQIYPDIEDAKPRVSDDNKDEDSRGIWPWGRKSAKPVHVEMRMSSPAEWKDLAFARDAMAQYEAMPRRVLRADFLRYLVLALEGGVYSDVDTRLIRNIRDWVPEAMRAQTRLIVGLEADMSPPVRGTIYEVQFCQWTLASAADHPTMWTMLDRILRKSKQTRGGVFGKKLSDEDVLAITGPAAWTEVVFEHLDQVAGTGVGAPRITWETLTGMKEPRLYGDTLVLPIDGFATGVPHSHASQRTSQQTLVRHHFQGKWRDNRG
ncbi:hypothetical protein SEPCBS119000_005894 [Sporothrix epigloea]|uniref:Initiation-specific alpha-1,6-mannosyltransferase n=1 Tax=Sporothrix epigloea TaxID=1892477 RepID=A0ABP0E1W8_9PEZI